MLSVKLEAAGKFTGGVTFPRSPPTTVSHGLGSANGGAGWLYDTVLAGQRCRRLADEHYLQACLFQFACDYDSFSFWEKGAATVLPKAKTKKKNGEPLFVSDFLFNCLSI